MFDGVAPSKQAVQSMVVALFTLTERLERARWRKQAASALNLLQVIARQDGIRPSDIAAEQLVDRSHVTRQVRELEDAGFVDVAGDPGDGRSWLVTLTPAGQEEMRRLQQVGLDRFALFVAEWDEADVRALAALLDRLRESMAAVGEREQRTVVRRQRSRVADARDRAARQEDGNE
jgi:DNA-binding MarR family transcriptional regulator